MNGQAITFDFHNTLADCPAWFDLEVKHLPSSFLQWWASASGVERLPAQALAEADVRYRQLRREIMDHGNELTAEESLEAVFGAMGLSIPEPELIAGVEQLMREALAGTTPIPGAVETIQTIHREGVDIGVVSSAVYHPFLEWALESFGIRSAIRVVITSASAGYYKSRPEIYHHAAEEIGADPARMVHVGDSLRFDVAGARRAGMGTVWLRHDRDGLTDETIVPDLTLHTLEGAAPDIMRLLESRAAAHDASRGRA